MPAQKNLLRKAGGMALVLAAQSAIHERSLYLGEPPHRSESYPLVAALLGGTPFADENIRLLMKNRASAAQATIPFAKSVNAERAGYTDAMIEKCRRSTLDRYPSVGKHIMDGGVLDRLALFTDPIEPSDDEKARAEAAASLVAVDPVVSWDAPLVDLVPPPLETSPPPPTLLKERDPYRGLRDRRKKHATSAAPGTPPPAFTPPVAPEGDGPRGRLRMADYRWVFENYGDTNVPAEAAPSPGVFALLRKCQADDKTYATVLAALKDQKAGDDDVNEAARRRIGFDRTLVQEFDAAWPALDALLNGCLDRADARAVAAGYDAIPALPAATDPDDPEYVDDVPDDALEGGPA